MAVRQKQAILNTAYKQFKEFELPLDIEYKNYVDIVGPRQAIHPISVKRSFKSWKYILHALRLNYPELSQAPVVVSEPPAPEPKSDPLAALSKAAVPTADLESDE